VYEQTVITLELLEVFWRLSLLMIVMQRYTCWFGEGVARMYSSFTDLATAIGDLDPLF
jgi:hypothetical protein